LGSSPSQKLKDALERLGFHVTVNAHPTAAKFDLEFRFRRAVQEANTTAAARPSTPGPAQD
jgi:hypothetical protein